MAALQPLRTFAMMDNRSRYRIASRLAETQVRTAGRLDADTKRAVNSRLSKLSGRHKAIGRAMSQMEKVLHDHSLGSVGVIAPWDLSVKDGSIDLELELTHPTVVHLTNARIQASWTMDGGGYDMRFKLV